MSFDTARNISLEELDKQVLLHPVTSITEHQEKSFKIQLEIFENQ